MTFDPYTNERPLSMLTEEQARQIKESGPPWMLWHHLNCHWFVTDNPTWTPFMVYRAVRKPAISVKWECLPKWIRWVVMHRDERVSAFEKLPYACQSYSGLWSSRGEAMTLRTASGLSVYPPGVFEVHTDDWTQAIAQRPGEG